MVRTRVAVQDTLPGTDTELSLLCDQVLDARAGMETAREGLHAVEAKLIEVMSAAGKKSIKHEGRIIRLVHQEEKNKIQVQSE